MQQLSSVLQEIEALKISSAASPNPLESSYSRPSLTQEQNFQEEIDDLVQPSPLRPPHADRSAPLLADASNVFTEFHTLGQSASQNNPPKVYVVGREERVLGDPRSKYLTPSTHEEGKTEEGIEASVRTGNFIETPNLTQFSGGQIYGEAVSAHNTKDKIKRFSHFLQQQAQQQPLQPEPNNRPPITGYSRAKQETFQFILPQTGQRVAPLVRHDLRKKKPQPENNAAPLSARKKKTMEAQKNQEMLFKPKLNKISVQLDKQHEAGGGAKKRWERLHALKGQREMAQQSKISKHLEEKLEEEIAECSFKPQIETHHIHHYLQGNVVERTLVWQQERNLKLEKTKQQVLEEELQQCSFRPVKADELKKEGGEGGAQPRREESDWYEINGVQKHLERVFVGRQTRQEKEQILALRYSPPNARWKNEPTRTQEFRFLLDDRKDPFLSTSQELSRSVREEAPQQERKLAYPIGTFGRTSGNFPPVEEDRSGQRRERREEEEQEEEQLRIGDPSVEFDDALDILHNSLHDMRV